jgi:hypothetical protein
VVLLVAVVTVSVHAQSPPTNRVRLDSCIRRTVQAASTHWGTGHFDINVDVSSSSMLLSSALWQATKEGVQSGTTGLIGKRLHARVTKASTTYVAIGDDRVSRTVSFGAAFEVHGEIMEAHSLTPDALLWAGEQESSVTDTLECGSLALVEQPDDIPALHGADVCASASNAFSGIVEPVLLAIASATIIILLFTLRGH